MSVRHGLYRTYWGMRRLIVPQLQYSQHEYEGVLREHIDGDTDWLDLGCGRQLLPAWRADAERGLVAASKGIVGVDYDFDSLHTNTTIRRKVRGDITQLPFRDAAFDLVTANMVVEHLACPSEQFREVNRILRPGGKFVFHTPNEFSHFALMRKLTPARVKDDIVWLLDGRKPEDVFEVHYRANSVRRIRQLAGDAGFRVMHLRMLASDAVFAVIPPLAFLELLWIRALLTRPLEGLRTNIIAVLEKPARPT